MLGFEPKYWISGDSKLMELNTTIFKTAARMVVIYHIVILGQYFGLAKLNSLSFIPLNLFECAYLVIFTNYVRAMTGCNQSYT